jgi:GNAT superfamily N-acetyltransferase
MTDSVQIEEISYTKAPMDLLLQADPSREKINTYLSQSRCFSVVLDEINYGLYDEVIVGIYVIKPISHLSSNVNVYELMNIAVLERYQKQGIGMQLLQHAISFAREKGASRLEVGTGTFGYQLAFYQREGFRVSEIVRDFFVDNYEEPIYENGIQHKDMLRLVIEYKPT